VTLRDILSIERWVEELGLSERWAEALRLATDAG